ncbi:hypothetical protein N7447_000948 [Penicillium robsamsonii]|uniref:uncharacterized protein n=1 Tax=Penicillium robsamsonii TaxID=1792511 RepID=UPI002548F432|nr:uncharacterized protein N7447_000948 [Penicillium robsamsonii]KAJ5834922.1 hypothetical protein N7447_000948 [Penicillium robsamsonii]
MTSHFVRLLVFVEPDRGDNCPLLPLDALNLTSTLSPTPICQNYNISKVMDPRPYHILSYGTLLGTQFYQSFVGGFVAFRALPRPQFSSLQTAIFPIYFSLQTALPVVVALTASHGGQVLGLSGLAAPENRFDTLLPLATVAVTGLVNMFVLRPMTINVMRERKHQESRDGKRSYDPAPHSKEMLALNKKFGRVHGISSLVNLASLVATVWYGVVLSKRLE